MVMVIPYFLPQDENADAVLVVVNALTPGRDYFRVLSPLTNNIAGRTET